MVGYHQQNSFGFGDGLEGVEEHEVGRKNPSWESHRLADLLISLFHASSAHLYGGGNSPRIRHQPHFAAIIKKTDH
jgi:hypothetical protein